MSTSKPGATADADPAISIGDEVGIIGVHVVVPGVVEGRGYPSSLGPPPRLPYNGDDELTMNFNRYSAVRDQMACRRAG